MTLIAPARSRGSAPSREALRPDKPLYVAAEWIQRHCVIPDGFHAGRPFRLYDYQLEYIGAFYLVRGDAVSSPTNPTLAPAFVHRRGMLVGPQKVGKNPIIAAQVCLEGVGPAVFIGWAGSDDGYVCREHGCRCGWEYPYEPGEAMGMAWPTPLIQITAFSEESTENTYDALRPMIELGPLSALIPKTGEEFIRLPGGGKIDTVTASALSRLGQRVTFVPQDEVGIWTAQNKMQKVADTQYRGLAGMGGRASLTSNAWDPAENSVAQQQFESPVSDVYRQFVQPPKTLSYSDKRDRRKIHRIVYPPDTIKENGGHVDLDSIENEAADLVERDAPQAMRFYGNILVAGAGHAVDPDVWDSLARPGTIAAGTRVGGGFDGSISEDTTVIRGCTAEGFSFIHEAWEKPYGTELTRWLDAHPGRTRWEVDRLEVAGSIDRFFRTYDVGRFYVDPPWWRTEAETWALKYGEEVVLEFYTKSVSAMAPAVDRWLTGIATRSHTHDADPMTDAHVKAAHRQKVRLADQEDDKRTLYILVKGSDKRKIDGAVTDVLAYEAAMTMPASTVVKRLAPFFV